MKLVSWNVNGIRACMTKGFEKFLNKLMQIYFVYKKQNANQNKLN